MVATTVALPSGPVLLDAADTLPPPLATAQVTSAPSNGLPLVSEARTVSGAASAEPATALCSPPETTSIFASVVPGTQKPAVPQVA